jgi:hypothetical protein
MTMKFGETAAGYFKSGNKAGILKRPQRQIDHLRRSGDKNDYWYRELKKFSSKQEARTFETQKIDQARSTDPNACPMNKGRH